MSEYINKIIIPTLDGECELSLDHKANVDNVYKKNETYVELSWEEYVDLASKNNLSNNTIYSVPDIGLYIGKRPIWEVVDDCLPKEGIIMGRFTPDSGKSNNLKWGVYLNDWVYFDLTKYTNPITKQFYLNLNNMPSEWEGGEITKIRFGNSHTSYPSDCGQSLKTAIIYLSPEIEDVSNMFCFCNFLEEIYMTIMGTIRYAKMFTTNCESLRYFEYVGRYASFYAVEDQSRIWGGKYLSEIPDGDASNNATDMSYKYSGCSSITKLNIRIPSTVTNISSLFGGCSSLQYIDYYQSSSISTENVTNMSGLFGGCKSLLNNPRIVRYFDTSSVTDMSSMFTECYNITSLNLSNFNTSNVTRMNSMFNNCTSLTTLDLSNFDTSKVTTMENMFRDCSSLTTLDLSNFDTSNVTTMRYMFNNCTSLTTLDLSNFDASNVTTMDYMFENCSRLTTLDLSNFDASNVTTMDYMFENCSRLTTLDLSNFDASNVTRMNYMFNNCTSLTTLDLSNFNNSNVTRMYHMFSNCSSLTTLDLSNFDTSKVTDMGYMFQGCSSLTTLDLSNFNTSNVIQMIEMFSGCTGLTTLDLSNFDTSKVGSFRGMFSGCSSLTTLDLSNFDASRIYNSHEIDDMFRGCSSLTTVTGSITGIWASLDLSDSPLTADSAMVFINGLSRVTSKRTLKLKSTTYDSLTPEQIAIATSKGWNVTRS